MKTCVPICNIHKYHLQDKDEKKNMYGYNRAKLIANIFLRRQREPDSIKY